MLRETRNLEDKKLLILGATNTVCEIVEEARSLGIKTYVTDYNSDSPAKKISDGSFMVSATDIEALVDLCITEKMDGVFTGYLDVLLPACQKVCEKLDFPFWGNEENISMCVDKELFKKACARSGVPVVPWMGVTRENYRDLIQDIDTPVVIKPADYSGSKGVYKCYNKNELIDYVEKALSFSHSGKVLIERVMDANREFSVYYIMNHGQCYLTAMGDRYVDVIDPEIAPVGQGMLYPSIYLDEWIRDVDPCVRRFLQDNDMNNGFIFLQGFYDVGKFYIHEIGYRLNGGYTYDIIQFFSGYHQMHELLRFSLTGDMDKTAIAKSNPHFNGLGMIVTISLKPGTITYIAGIEKIRNMPGVLHFHQLHKKGDALLSHGTTAQVFAYILCGVKNKKELDHLIYEIKEALVVNDEKGVSMLRELIDPAKIKVNG